MVEVDSSTTSNAMTSELYFFRERALLRFCILLPRPSCMSTPFWYVNLHCVCIVILQNLIRKIFEPFLQNINCLILFQYRNMNSKSAMGEFEKILAIFGDLKVKEFLEQNFVQKLIQLKPQNDNNKQSFEITSALRDMIYYWVYQFITMLLLCVLPL